MQQLNNTDSDRVFCLFSWNCITRFMAGFVINNTYILHLHIYVFNFLFWSTVFAQEFDLFSIILNDDYTGKLVLKNYTATAGRPTDVRMFSVIYTCPCLCVSVCLWISIPYSILFSAFCPHREEREKYLTAHPYRRWYASTPTEKRSQRWL